MQNTKLNTDVGGLSLSIVLVIHKARAIDTHNQARHDQILQM